MRVKRVGSMRWGHMGSRDEVVGSRGGGDKNWGDQGVVGSRAGRVGVVGG